MGRVMRTWTLMTAILAGIASKTVTAQENEQIIETVGASPFALKTAITPGILELPAYAEALFLVGHALKKSNTCSNDQLAVDLLSKAVELGHPGAMLLQGNEDQLDIDDKAKILRNAAQADLRGVKQDFRFMAQSMVFRNALKDGNSDEIKAALERSLATAMKHISSPRTRLHHISSAREWHRLAIELLKGRYIERKIDDALGLLTAARAAGFRPARIVLGYFEAIEFGPNLDLVTFRHETMNQARAGEAKGLYALHFLVSYGIVDEKEITGIEGLNREGALTRKLLEKAAEAGSGEAQMQLARLMGNGPRGGKLLESAATAGYGPAVYELARIRHVKTSIADQAIIDAYQQAAEQGVREAQTALAITCLREIRTCAEPSENYVQMLQNNVKERRDYIAGTYLGEAYKADIFEEDSGIPIHYTASFSAFRAAAFAGSRLAQYELADSYERGIGTIVSEIDALFWYLQAVNSDKPIKNRLDGRKKSIEAINRMLNANGMCEGFVS